ncbi:MAG: hypothetical protein OZ921_13390, partial [Sorangiineae bacterium]|nr:hypothetical protein [Sorangiineae bacterium]
MTGELARKGMISGHELGRYELVLEITKSQLGALWAARSGDTLACVRRIPRSGLTEAVIGRLSEAGFWAMEQAHPHLARVTDVVATDGELGVVHEHVEGETLRSLLRLASFKRKPLPARLALRIGADLLEAVAFAESDENRAALDG